MPRLRRKFVVSSGPAAPSSVTGLKQPGTSGKVVFGVPKYQAPAKLVKHTKTLLQAFAQRLEH